MTLRTVDITWQGKPAKVEFEDSLTFGETENLVRTSVDLTDLTKPKIDLAMYRINLLVLTIKKAPFKTGDITTLRNIDSKIVQKILKEIVKVHPLTNYIEDWMETFISSEELTNLSTESTTTVPRSSDGIKKK